MANANSIVRSYADAIIAYVFVCKKIQASCFLQENVCIIAGGAQTLADLECAEKDDLIDIRIAFRKCGWVYRFLQSNLTLLVLQLRVVSGKFSGTTLF